MNRLLTVVAWAGLLGLVLLPPCLVFTEVQDPDTAKTLMLVGTAVWFVPALWRGLAADRAPTV